VHAFLQKSAVGDFARIHAASLNCTTVRTNLLVSIQTVQTVIGYLRHDGVTWQHFRTRCRAAVCTENLNPEVVVMESAEDGERF